MFRGAGWNVLKVIWGSYWDPLLARDTNGTLRKLMMETVDGEYQNCKAFGGAYTREHFFGKYPETREMVVNLSDDDIWRLNRGGHDPHKVYAAYHAAVNTKGMPTVILAKTVKGYGMGAAGESQNPTHQQKKLDNEAVRAFRDRFHIPVTDDKVDDVPYYHPGKDSPEVQYMLERRKALGGFLPQRRAQERIDRGAGSFRVRADHQELGRSRDLDDDGVRARHESPAARQAGRAAHRADRRRRSAHVRHGRHVPPDRHLRAVRPEVQAGRRRSADVLPRRPERPGAAGRHHRARRDVGMDRRRDELLGQQRADAAVLHLLLDVRFPARRRSLLGRRRHARARIPRRRHRRTHDVERRRPAARGRPFASDGRLDSELRFLRSDVLVRNRGDPAGRRAPHAEGAGRRLLLRHRDERELHASGDAQRRRSRHHQGHVSVARRR